MQGETQRPSKGSRKRAKPRQRPGPVDPASGDDAGHLLATLRALGPEAEEFAHRLIVANAFDLWADCPNEPCRRAKKCRGEDVVCFDEQRGELKRTILRQVVWLMCTARVSSDEFYHYLDEATEDDDGDEAQWPG